MRPTLKLIIVLGSALTAAGLAGAARAQTHAGEEFQYDADRSVQVLKCYVRNNIDFCQVNWGIPSQGFWSKPVEVWREDIDKLSRNFGGAQPTDPSVSDDDADKTAADVIAPEPQASRQPAVVAGCRPSTLTGSVPDTVAPSEALFRAKITDLFTGQAYDNWYYGVEFETFHVGDPINNDVTIDETQRAQLLSFGAPPNVPLYPIETRFRVCNNESATTFAERFHDSTYFCFPKAGEWTCGVSESR